MSEDVQSLLNQGLGLLNEGKRAEAADVLKRAVERDSENVAIWMALSQALESRDERRIALTTILQLDPGNEDAQRALAALERVGRPAAAAAEWRPGISRRDMTLTSTGLALFTLVVLGIAFSFYDSRSRAVAQVNQAATEVAQQATQLVITQTEVAIRAVTQAVAAQETALAINSPTPSATITPARVLPTPIPPTATPTATPDLSRIAPPPPSNLAGRLLAIGGRINQVSDFLPIKIYPAGGGSPSELNDDFGQSPTANDSFTQIAYARAVPGGGVSLLTVQTANPSPLGPESIDIINALFRIPATEPANPRMTRDGTRLVFSALVDERRVLFLYEYATQTLTRITPNDGADYPAADISPDGTRVIAIKRTSSTDLVLITLDPATNFAQTPLTNDSNVLVEEMVAFSPDGVQVAFAAAPPGGSADIFMAVLQGSAFTTVSPVIQLAGNDRGPVFSPDGSHLAYTSDTTGTRNIFVFNLATRENFQRTVEPSPVIVSDWTN